MDFKDFIKLWFGICGILSGVLVTVLGTIFAFIVDIIFGIFIAIVAISGWIAFGVWAMDQ